MLCGRKITARARQNSKSSLLTVSGQSHKPTHFREDERKKLSPDARNVLNILRMWATNNYVQNKIKL